MSMRSRLFSVLAAATPLLVKRKLVHEKREREKARQ